MSRNTEKEKRKPKHRHVLVWTVTVILTAAAVALLLYMLPKDDMDIDALLNETFTIETEPPQTEAEETEETEHVMVVPDPGIDEQLLTINDWSRPGEACDTITNVVIHYLANPGTTAQQNHDYFESLKDNDELIASGQITEDEAVYMSANFVIGIEGEIIECVPPGEVAYASNSANHYSVSIENCHVDTTGQFTEETYESLVKLTAYLVDMYDLDRDSIIRHYDVTGKMCPLYYVENEDKWEAFKDDVMAYIEECRAAAG
ncbi:MAG: peptidoglycan recognition protein family protein [Lachnospiraceae bacterium]|nr:peptidoglycan recognition protein family protein [Lachnospiraceae bacterium]